MKSTKLLCLIEPSQMADAKAIAERLGVSLAEVVRRALANYISSQQRAEKRVGRSYLMGPLGEVSDQQRRIGELVGEIREQKETQPQVAPQPTLADLMQRIERLEHARDSK